MLGLFICTILNLFARTLFVRLCHPNDELIRLGAARSKELANYKHGLLVSASGGRKQIVSFA